VFAWPQDRIPSQLFKDTVLASSLSEQTIELPKVFASQPRSVQLETEDIVGREVVGTGVGTGSVGADEGTAKTSAQQRTRTSDSGGAHVLSSTWKFAAPYSRRYPPSHGVEDHSSSLSMPHPDPRVSWFPSSSKVQRRAPAPAQSAVASSKEAAGSQTGTVLASSLPPQTSGLPCRSAFHPSSAQLEAERACTMRAAGWIAMHKIAAAVMV